MYCQSFYPDSNVSTRESNPGPLNEHEYFMNQVGNIPIEKYSYFHYNETTTKRFSLFLYVTRLITNYNNRFQYISHTPTNECRLSVLMMNDSGGATNLFHEADRNNINLTDYVLRNTAGKMLNLLPL